jgi:AcrR family transcriptional regulator
MAVLSIFKTTLEQARARRWRMTGRRRPLADKTRAMSANGGGMEESVLDRRKQRTRKAAVGAFVELLMTQGYEAVAMTAVAERADLGRSTLYEHFRTKDDLLAASLDWPLAVLAADPPDPAALQRLIEHVRERSGAVRIMLEQPLRSRIARLLAARIAPGVRVRGVPGPRADVRALACAEGQLAALGLWMQGSGVPAGVLAEELARLARAVAAP